MKMYKGFDKNLKCRDFQYEIGKTYTEDKAELCNAGFHTTGNWAHAATTGNWAHAATNGYRAHAEVSGKESIASAGLN